MTFIEQNGEPGKPRAIQTEYRGYKFRSRLEARWAVCFDKLDLEWTYEEEGYELPSGRYLPDFFFPDLNTYVEIKGRMAQADDKDAARLTDLSVAKNSACFLFAGDPVDLLNRPMNECFTWRVPAGHAYIADGHVIQFLLDVAGMRGVAAPLSKTEAHQSICSHLALAFNIAASLDWEPSPDWSDVGEMIAAALHQLPFIASPDWMVKVNEDEKKFAELISEDDPQFLGVVSAMRFVSHLSGERMSVAAAAARQARFEFGAKP